MVIKAYLKIILSPSLDPTLVSYLLFYLMNKITLTIVNTGLYMKKTTPAPGERRVQV